MEKPLQGMRIAVVATDGFEQSELLRPRKALTEAGAVVEVVAPKADWIQGMEAHQPGTRIEVDRTLDEAKANDYGALVLPGGVANADTLRTNQRAIAFVRHFVEGQKPIAAICHGPWALIEARAVQGRRVTSWPSLKTDLKNAGATWVNQEVVVDGALVTSRDPDDLPAFCAEIVDLFGQYTA